MKAIQHCDLLIHDNKLNKENLYYLSNFGIYMNRNNCLFQVGNAYRIIEFHRVSIVNESIKH